ncbi:MAG: hypothetical protein JRJ15_16360 [Deltaproteobacteria bacterium]|nr:hypothetical protein [Deltaproteobacteria bacterium]
MGLKTPRDFTKKAVKDLNDLSEAGKKAKKDLNVLSEAGKKAVENLNTRIEAIKKLTEDKGNQDSLTLDKIISAF